MAAADMGMGAPAPKKPAERRLLSLFLTIAFGFFFGIVAAVSFASWSRATVGDVPALVLGFVFAWILPLVLSVRAVLALKKKNRPVLLRRVVALFLVGLVQITVFLAGATHFQEDKALAQMSAAALPFFGPIPVVGGILEKRAKEGGMLGPQDPVKPTTTNAATGLSPRGGGRPIGAFAAGAQTAEGDLVVVVWSVAFGGALTPRTVDLASFASFGNPTRVEVADDGGAVVVLGGAQLLTIAPGAVVGAHDKALSRGAKVGDFEIQQVKDVAIAPGGALLLTVDGFDGKKAAVGHALIARGPAGAPYIVRRTGDGLDRANGGAPAEEKKRKAVSSTEKAIAATRESRDLGERAPDPEEEAKEEKLEQVTKPKPLPPADADETRTSFAFSIKAGSSDGNVVVEEEYLEGGVDQGVTTAGTEWVVNPRRLLVGQVAAPRALAEVARTDQDVSGIDGISLQAFGDATLLADGRVFFDANFVEDGPRGWLFSTRSGGGIFATAPELIGKPEAPFLDRAPRTRRLVVDGDGVAFAFLTKDGGVVKGPLTRLQDAKPVLKGDAVRPDGSRAGGLAAASVVRLAKGGEFMAASVELLADGGARNRAVVWASNADLAAQKAEVLLEVGGLIPQNPLPPAPPPPPEDPKKKKDPKEAPPTAPPPPTPPKVQKARTIFFFDGHEELLWQAG